MPANTFGDVVTTAKRVGRYGETHVKLVADPVIQRFDRFVGNLLNRLGKVQSDIPTVPHETPLLNAEPGELAMIQHLLSR